MPKATSWWIETQLYSPGNLWDQHLGAKPLRKSLESDLSSKTHGCMECPVFGKCGKVVRSSKCPAGGIQGQPDHQRHVQWNHKLWTNIDMHRLYRWILSEKATRNMKEWDLLVPNSAFPHILTYILDPVLGALPLPSLWAKPTPLRTWRPSSLRLCELETFQETLCEFSVNQLKRNEWKRLTLDLWYCRRKYLFKIIVILSIKTNTCTSLNSITRTFWTVDDFKLPTFILGNWRNPSIQPTINYYWEGLPSKPGETSAIPWI